MVYQVETKYTLKIYEQIQNHLGLYLRAFGLGKWSFPVVLFKPDTSNPLIFLVVQRI